MEELSSEAQAILRDQVSPVVDFELAQFYDDWAAFLRKDTQMLRTNKDFRDAYVLSADIAFEKSKAGKHPGLAQAVDSIIASQIGTQADAPLNRLKLAAAMAAIGQELK